MVFLDEIYDWRSVPLVMAFLTVRCVQIKKNPSWFEILTPYLQYLLPVLQRLWIRLRETHSQHLVLRAVNGFCLQSVE